MLGQELFEGELVGEELMKLWECEQRNESCCGRRFVVGEELMKLWEWERRNESCCGGRFVVGEELMKLLGVGAKEWELLLWEVCCSGRTYEIVGSGNTGMGIAAVGGLLFGVNL